MAAAIAQTVQGNGGGYVNSYTKAITPTAGSTLIVSLAMGAANTFTLTDDKGNTWTQKATILLTGQRKIDIWQAYNVASGATTITFQAAVDTYPDSAVIIDEITGLTTTDPFDTSVTSTTSSGTTYASGSTPTTAQAGEILIGGIAVDSSTPLFTGDASWAGLLTQAGSDLYTSVTRQYRIVSSTGAYGWILTNASSRQASQAVATFKETITSPAGNTTNFFQFIN